MYDRLATGEPPSEDPTPLAGALARRALQQTLDPTPEARLGALAVAAAVGWPLGASVIRALIDDPADEVRSRALALAIEAGPEGIGVLRGAAAGSDPRLVADALTRLGRIKDASAAPAARGALAHPDAAVRAAAAYLLGRVAGPSTQTALGALATGDPDPKVQRAAHEALERISGRRERGPAEPWWAAPQQAPSPPTPGSEPPVDPRILARRIATTSGPEQAAALSALQPRQITELLASWAPGADLQLGRGLILAATLLQIPTAATRLRQLTTAREPEIRAGAAEGLGVLAGPSVLPVLTRLLDDPSGEVRAAAVGAVTAVSIRSGRADFAREALARLSPEQPARVVEAILAAHRELDQ